MSTDDLREYVKDRLSRYPAIDCALHFDLRRWLHDHPTSKSTPVLPEWVHDPATYCQHLRGLGYGPNEATVGGIGYDAGQKSRPLTDPADAIVIPRADLPRLTTTVGSVSAKVFTWSKSCDPADLRETAACYLAAAEYLDAHPPEDEAQVAALTGILANEGDGGIWEHFDHTNAAEVARRLVARGVRVDLP